MLNHWRSFVQWSSRRVVGRTAQKMLKWGAERHRKSLIVVTNVVLPISLETPSLVGGGGGTQPCWASVQL